MARNNNEAAYSDLAALALSPPPEASDAPEAPEGEPAAEEPSEEPGDAEPPVDVEEEPIEEEVPSETEEVIEDETPSEPEEPDEEAELRREEAAERRRELQEKQFERAQKAAEAEARRRAEAEAQANRYRDPKFVREVATQMGLDLDDPEMGVLNAYVVSRDLEKTSQIMAQDRKIALLEQQIGAIFGAAQQAQISATVPTVLANELKGFEVPQETQQSLTEQLTNYVRHGWTPEDAARELVKPIRPLLKKAHAEKSKPKPTSPARLRDVSNPDRERVLRSSSAREGTQQPIKKQPSNPRARADEALALLSRSNTR